MSEVEPEWLTAQRLENERANAQSRGCLLGTPLWLLAALPLLTLDPTLHSPYALPYLVILAAILTVVARRVAKPDSLFRYACYTGAAVSVMGATFLVLASSFS